MFHKKNIIIYIITLLSILLLIFLICKFIINVPEKDIKITEKEMIDIKVIAKKNILILKKTLMKQLKSNINNGGFIKGAKFCSLSAVKIEKAASKKFDEGVSVQRISLKNRNIKNYPTEEDDKNILMMIEKNIKDGKDIKPMIIKKISDKHYKAYKLIFIKPLCIKCHGDTTMLDKEAYNIIKQHYPKDKAINYKVGDFRGVFLVNIYK